MITQLALNWQAVLSECVQAMGARAKFEKLGVDAIERPTNARVAAMLEQEQAMDKAHQTVGEAVMVEYRKQLEIRKAQERVVVITLSYHMMEVMTSLLMGRLGDYVEAIEEDSSFEPGVELSEIPAILEVFYMQADSDDYPWLASDISEAQQQVGYATSMLGK